MVRQAEKINVDYPETVEGSAVGTVRGVLNNVSSWYEDDPVYELLGDVAATASGCLGGVGDLVGMDTMTIIDMIASGELDMDSLPASVVDDLQDIIDQYLNTSTGDNGNSCKSSSSGCCGKKSSCSGGSCSKGKCCGGGSCSGGSCGSGACSGGSCSGSSAASGSQCMSSAMSAITSALGNCGT